MSKLRRSKFNLSHYHLLTADMGNLIPIGVIDCLPGDTFNMSTKSFIRVAPMLAPVMHPIRVRIHHWFVPYRLLWSEFPDFITGGRDGLAKPAMPKITIPKPADGQEKSLLNTLHDYMGLPIDSLVDDLSVSALPYRAYNLIYNNFYRDEDLQNELPISYDSGADTLTNTQMQRVSWSKDYFTTARPWTQKGAEIGVPVFSSSSELKRYEVYQFELVYYDRNGALISNPEACHRGVSDTPTFNPNWYKASNLSNFVDWINEGNNKQNIGALLIPNKDTGSFLEPNQKFNASTNILGSSGWNINVGIRYMGMEYKETTANIQNEYAAIYGSFPSSAVCTVDYDVGNDGRQLINTKYVFTITMGTTTTGQSGFMNLNDLRLAASLQRFQEARAKWGSRYIEYLQYYGINPSDKRLQLPEYLGGGKSTIQISEVLQTSPDQDSYVGDMYGHGVSSMKSNRFRYFCEEHGVILSLMSILPDNMYQQGIDRFWLKDTKEELYIRELANIGMQSIYRGEIYPSSKETIKEPFGYQDRYNEYRHMQSKIHGDFRDTLDYWHLARKFASPPFLNSEFLKCEPSKRIFAEQTSNEFYVMAWHQILAKRCMPKKAKTFLK